MENNVSQIIEPRKRKIWVSVLLTTFGPGLPIIYCGNLKLGIIIEILMGLFYIMFIVLLGIVMELWYLILLVVVMIFTLVAFICFNINYTKKANNNNVPWLSKPRLKIFLVLTIVAGFDIGFDEFRMRYIVEAYSMPSGSMANTLQVGDYLMASKKWLIGDIENGDLIIFRYPGNPAIGRIDQGPNYLKRCIAQEGQTVKIVDKQVYVDNKLIPLPEHGQYSIDQIRPYYNSVAGRLDNLPKFTVPKNKLFVLGDNRDNSSDSRVWGFLDKADVYGNTRFIHFSWDSENNRIRWERMGMRLDN